MFELLEAAACSNANLVPILPQVVKAMKQALNTRDPGIVYATLKVSGVRADLKSHGNPMNLNDAISHTQVLQQLAICEGVGAALKDYYRQILPVCNILKVS